MPIVKPKGMIIKGEKNEKTFLALNVEKEIAAMWRFTKSNGITEGFHRKMKLIQRRAYGFKNFENYRLRVRVLCGSMNLNSILT